MISNKYQAGFGRGTRLGLGLCLLSAAALTACVAEAEDATGTLTPTEVAGTPTMTVEPTATEAPAATGTGTLALTFRLNEDVAPFLREDPIGPFWGGIYYSYDVNGLGPVADAELLESIYIEEVVLNADGTATEVLYVTGELPNVSVAVLGFLNSDDEDGQENDDYPDTFDPVTLPGDGHHLVVEGQETQAEVYFGLLNP